MCIESSLWSLPLAFSCFSLRSDCISDLPGTVYTLFWATVFHPDDSREKRREGWQTSALGGDKFRDICDMETIPPETDVLINKAHFPSFTCNRQQSGQYTAVVRRVETMSRADPQRTPTVKPTFSNWCGLAGSNCSSVKGQLEHLDYWAQ